MTRSYMSFGSRSVTCTVWPILFIRLSLHVHSLTCLSIPSLIALCVSASILLVFVISSTLRLGRHGLCGSRTYNYAAPSGIRGRKAPKDGQQPCFTPKGRCHLSKSLMAATVRLSRSWADLYRHRPLFTLFYRRHPHQKIVTAPPWSYCCRGDFPCLVGVPHRSGRRTLALTCRRKLKRRRSVGWRRSGAVL